MTARRRISLIVLTTLVALPIAGTIYQSVSVRRESGRFPPPGRLINVARPGEPARRLHLICIGQGAPTVIFEAGGFGGSLSASAARQEVSAQTRVCSYDRMGMGWSDPGPDVIPAGLLADDLERLTTEAALPPPFILAPASIGGLPAELFARRHPDQVAGLVWVDAGNSVMTERFGPQINRKLVEAVCLVKTVARAGALRLLDPFHLRQLPPDDAARSIALIYRVEPVATLCGITRAHLITDEQFAAAPPLPADVPLTVLVHERPTGFPPGFESQTRDLMREWLPLQQRFAQRSSRGRWTVVPGSDHMIGSGQPHVVASAVLEMVAEFRARRAKVLVK